MVLILDNFIQLWQAERWVRDVKYRDDGERSAESWRRREYLREPRVSCWFGAFVHGWMRNVNDRD